MPESVADLRSVMGSGSYSRAGAVYRGNASDRTAASELDRLTAGVRVSAHVPAVASDKQNNVVRLGMRRDMVSPIWEGVTLIPDEITQAKKGEIVITAVLLHAVKTRSLGRFPSNSKFKPRERLSAMPGILLSGPAGGGKSQAARDLLRAASEPTVAADFQAIVAALLLQERGPDGKYPIRPAWVLPLVEYVRQAVITAANERGIDLIVTNSDGAPPRRGGAAC